MENFKRTQENLPREDSQEVEKGNGTIDNVLVFFETHDKGAMDAKNDFIGKSLIAIEKAYGGNTNLKDALFYLQNMHDGANENLKPFVQNTIDYISEFETHTKKAEQDIHIKDEKHKDQSTKEAEMFDMLAEKLYGGEKTDEDLFNQIRQTEENIQKEIKDNKQKVKMLQELLEIFSYKTVFPTIKKWDRLLVANNVCGKLKRDFFSEIREPGFKSIAIIVIDRIERGVSEDKINWEDGAKDFISIVNEYLEKNDNSLDESTERKLTAFMTSIGLKQINPDKGGMFNSRLHNSREIVENSGLERGVVVRVINRGVASGDKVLQRAVVDIAR